jgi:hypothetical protein
MIYPPISPDKRRFTAYEKQENVVNVVNRNKGEQLFAESDSSMSTWEGKWKQMGDCSMKNEHQHASLVQKKKKLFSLFNIGEGDAMEATTKLGKYQINMYIMHNVTLFKTGCSSYLTISYLYPTNKISNVFKLNSGTVYRPT